MNHALYYHIGTDPFFRRSQVATVDSGAFGGRFSNDRLKAFRTRFTPSSETFGRQLSNYAVTAGIYAAIAAAAVGLSTADITPLLHVLHLNGV
jgi:hypothetical protein